MESLGWEREVRRESRQLTSITTMLETPALHLHLKRQIDKSIKLMTIPRTGSILHNGSRSYLELKVKSKFWLVYKKISIVKVRGGFKH
jgi:hypothetical protein